MGSENIVKPVNEGHTLWYFKVWGTVDFSQKPGRS